MLYGLKQARHKWNIEFDSKMTKHDFTQLVSNLCIYICYDHKGVAIITVWVDNLLLFTLSDKAMEAMVDNVKSEWQMTDLREPSKIVSIKIAINNHTVTIS